MIRLIAVLAAVLCFLAPIQAASQPRAQPSAQAAEQPRSQLVTHQGVPGMWFPMASAERLLADIETLASLRLQVNLLDQRIRLGDETKQLLRENLSYTQQQSDHWRTALRAAVSTRQSSPSVWQSPTFWFFVGFTSAAVMAVGLTFGLRAASD